jgi:hypothetical protein
MKGIDWYENKKAPIVFTTGAGLNNLPFIKIIHNESTF